MPGDIVNLRQFRKSKARAEKDAKAEQNRAKFGRTKGQKQLDKASRRRSPPPPRRPQDRN
jgi:hypothetical protein